MRVNRSRIAGAVLAVATVGASTLVPIAAPAPARAHGVDLVARMRPTDAYPNARGGAWYESHQDWREFDIHVRGIKKLAGKRVRVTVHGDFIGRMRVSKYGRAHLHREDGVPVMHGGDRVRVRTKSGSLVTYGKLRTHHHMMRS